MTIISSEVASPSPWPRPMKTVSAGTKRMPPPTPTRPPARPPARQTRTARTSFNGLRPRSWSLEDQVHRHRDQQQGEQVGDRLLRDPLLDRGAADYADDRRDRQQQSRQHVDVAVDAALGDRPETADDDDRGEAGAGGEALAVAEPEDQQGDDDRAAADPEEAPEAPRGGADRGQPQQLVSAGRRVSLGHAAILSVDGGQIRDHP